MPKPAATNLETNTAPEHATVGVGDLDALFDDVLAEVTGATAAPAPRAAGEPLGSEAKHTVSALDYAINSLGALFGGGRLSSGLAFDEDTYAKAKPLFASAVANLKETSSDLRDAMRAVVRLVVECFGADTANNMKPYVVRFIADVRDGKAKLQGDTDERVTLPNQVAEDGFGFRFRFQQDQLA